MRVRLINAWWILRLKWRPVGHVVWGGRDWDMWIGSAEDLRHQRMLKVAAINRRIMVSFTVHTQAFEQSMRKVAAAFGEAAQKMAKAMGPVAAAFADAELAEKYRELYDQKG